MSGIELFERASEARARLLRAERLGLGVVLTFDVGLITLEPEAAGGVAIAHPESREEITGTLEPLDEEEPWWRLLGSPLTEARWAGAEQRELRLRFNEATETPRWVVIASQGPSLAARLASS